MKNVTYFFILFLLILTPPLFADKNSNEEVLKRLDRIIDKMCIRDSLPAYRKPRIKYSKYTLFAVHPAFLSIGPTI